MQSNACARISREMSTKNEKLNSNELYFIDITKYVT